MSADARAGWPRNSTIFSGNARDNSFRKQFFENDLILPEKTRLYLPTSTRRYLESAFRRQFPSLGVPQTGQYIDLVLQLLDQRVDTMDFLGDTGLPLRNDPSLESRHTLTNILLRERAPSEVVGFATRNLVEWRECLGESRDQSDDPDKAYDQQYGPAIHRIPDGSYYSSGDSVIR